MNLYELFVKIGMDTGELEKGIDHSKELMDKFSKVSVSVLGAAGAGIAALVKQSVSGYANYEQLVGGVETLFKGSSQAVIENAQNAFRTAGLSANEYMETVTSFSASLLQSLGGDTKETAKIADMAITDMSDNANKMGTSMESIQNAYQGFAKQNYTMLDNLKLGFGGTKEEMERLLAEAEKLSGVEYDISSLSDVYNAIHVVQTELGITGTTAKEASKTISGSLASTKKAFENLVVGLSTDNADIETMFDNLKSSASDALKNISVRVAQFHEGFNDLRDISPIFDTIVSSVEILGATFATVKISSFIAGMAASFEKASLQVSLFALENGNAALANAGLTAQLTLGETAVGLLTGKISLATAAQTIWNKVMTANPIGLVITAVSGLTAGIIALNKQQREIVDGLAGVSETSEEAAKKVEELKNRIQELDDYPAEFWSDIQQTEYDNLRLALKQAEKQYEELKEAEIAAAEEAASPANKAEEATERFSEQMGELIKTYQDTYNRIYDNVTNWFSPFEEAKTTIETSVSDMIKAMQSQMNFNNAYSDNLQKLAEYGLGSMAEYFAQVGSDGAAYAAAIVAEVENAGGAASDGGQQIISAFSALSDGVAESQADVAESLTNLSTDFSTSISSMVTELSEGIAELDETEEAYASAQNTMAGYLQGINEGTSPIVAAVQGLISQINAALSSSAQNASAAISSVGGGKGSGNAGGLDYVPYNGFNATLHRGESVLTAREADAWRNGGGNGGTARETVIPITLNLNSNIDGMRFAENQYKYNLIVSRNHGVRMVNA